MSAASGPFDVMASGTVVWAMKHPCGQFSVEFLNGHLHLIHDAHERESTCYAEQMSDEDEATLVTVLYQHLLWMRG